MDLEERKKYLQKTRVILEERLERVARHTRRRPEPIPQDFAEQATALENDELMATLDDDLVDKLAMINRALARIQSGEYTMCAHCGEEIAEERLLAIPDTQLCYPCADKRA